MSSCRGRAEAFARRLSSKLLTLGSQPVNEPTSKDGEHFIKDNATNNWISNAFNDTVTDLQPLHHESDSLFEFDCELESPNSPAEECEYLRLIETASNTPHNSLGNSGYECASATTIHSSTDISCFNDTNLAAPCSSTKSVTAEVPSKTDHLSCIRNPQNLIEKPCSFNSVSIHHVGENIVLYRYGETNGGEHDSTGSSECADQMKPAKLIECEGFTKAMNAEKTINNEFQKKSEQPSVASANDYSVNDKQQTTHPYQYVTPMGAQHDVLESKNVQLNFQTNVFLENDDEVLKNLVKDTINDIADKRNAGSIKKETKLTNSNEASFECGAALDTTDDEDDLRPQRVRRCSSLKTGKTPPGTPGCKKIVRFADVLGLDLADIKTFLDEIPTIPKSAFKDLEVIDAEPPVQLGPKSHKCLVPLFQQPGGLSTFLDQVREKLVSLENAVVTDHINLTITGLVSVRNLDFHKSVHIRYTQDNWHSFADLQANYVENSCDGFSDKFTFILYGNTLQIGERLEFAVRFQCKGQQFWDSNYGSNYCFQCLPTSYPTPSQIQPTMPSHRANNLIGMLSPTAGDAWCSSFY